MERHSSTVTLKTDLGAIGYPVPGNGTNVYGNDTEKVVKQFQNENGLVVNGIADEITLAKIAEIKKAQDSVPILRNGMRHAEVKVLKSNLGKLGFQVPGNGTTLFGADTERKVREFQSYYKLGVDGVVGPATQAKIKSILNSPLQNGKRHSNTQKLKKDLAAIGYPVPGNGTTLYGKDTERVVRQFQRDYKLAVNGIADEITLAKIASIRSSGKVTKIFIDPGHGGSDPGATGNGLLEKTINLDISQRIEKYLNQYQNVVVRMSRTNDTFVSLSSRTKMANDWGADYFVSVHANADNQEQANGFESFIHSGARGTADARAKQSIIHDHIARNISETNRGKKEANFQVLREANMSSILLEYLFITNRQNSNQLKNSSYRDRVARLTAEGIAQAYNLKKK
ncbi:N-acetylmuramoyl-L-alanine amidase [Alkalihalobacillus trypoxylicola]|uniref:MurNAc-LAA domain-containing protein n=2 Tax=Alkalihalobacillus trypoxylicola TaxID=519424 RepID=A0A162DUR0_9BACI|nr:N-acetylmuramoyl-L-alanine amidase [Alkalihalobacillus trypoxylicola]KYG30891.1 hypothetical protein AZF04_18780 [Alkalihalobacillus trypoxylicola]